MKTFILRLKLAWYEFLIGEEFNPALSRKIDELRLKIEG